MSKGLQDYQRAIQGLQSSRDSVQSYIDNYDSDFFQNWRDNLKPVKDVVGGVQKAVDEFDTAYLGGKILHATYKGLKKKLTKKGDDPGDEEGKDEKTEDSTGEEENNSAPDVEDTPEGSSGAVKTENVNPPKESVEKAQPDEPSAEAVGGEPEETEATLDKTPEEDTRLFDNLKDAPEPTKENFGLSEGSNPSEANTYSLVAPEDLSSSDAVLGGAGNAYTGSIKGFNSALTEPDEFDLPSGLADTSGLFGQGETTATRLANNNLIGGGGRAGPEILGQRTEGGFQPVSDDPEAIPKIQTQGLSSEQEALQLFPKERPPAEQETIPTDDSPIFPGTQQGKDTSTGTQGQEQVKSNTGEADGDMLNQGDRLKSLASGDNVSPSSLLEQGKTLTQGAGDDAGGFLSSASDLISAGAEGIGGAIDAGIGVASGVLDALGPIGLVGGLGLGLYEAFKPPPKKKTPPPAPKIATFASKGEMVLPSYDSVVDAPASSQAF